jgi:hypothetical protein
MGDQEVGSCCRLRIAITLLSTVVVLGFDDPCAEAVDLQQAIENAEIIRTFPIAGASIGRFRTGNDAIAIQFQEHDSTMVAAYDLSGDLLFRNSRPSAGRPMLRIDEISDDGSTFLMTEDLGYYDLRRFAVDRQGQELCELPIDAGIQVSPSGRYFCPLYQDVTSPKFEIYDLAGTRIEYKGKIRNAWNAAFLNDSIILLADMLDVKLVEASTGRNISTTPSYLSNRVAGWPDIAVSTADSVAILYYDQGMQAVSFSGETI